MIIRVNVSFSQECLHFNRKSYFNSKERIANEELSIVMHELERMGKVSRHTSNQTTWVATYSSNEQC